MNINIRKEKLFKDMKKRIIKDPYEKNRFLKVIFKAYEEVIPDNELLHFGAVFGMYTLHYENLINLSISKIDDLDMNIAILFLINHYLELYVKELCWNYSKEESYLELGMNTHSLKKILNKHKRRIISSQLHTEKEISEIILIIDSIEKLCGNNPSILLRYPIEVNSVDLALSFEDIKKITKQEVVKLWDRIYDIKLKRMVNASVLYEPFMKKFSEENDIKNKLK